VWWLVETRDQDLLLCRSNRLRTQRAVSELDKMDKKQVRIAGSKASAAGCLLPVRCTYLRGAQFTLTHSLLGPSFPTQASLLLQRRLQDIITTN